MILLGERGQAKTRVIRSLTSLLDEWVPVVAGSEVNDDPYQPISRLGRDLVAEKGDETPVEWIGRDQRFGEKLATPDTSVADLIGEVDPIRVAEGRYLSDELTLHYGLVPRANRGIFAINELPDLAERIQVGLLNVLEERDVQVRGYKATPALSRSQANGATARSAGALSGGRDVEVTLGPTGFKEAVVLPTLPAPASYLDEFVLPPGVTARPSRVGVDFLDRRGQTVASFGGGIAFDAADTASGDGAETSVTTRLVSQKANVAVVEVEVDPAWLADPARQAPVTIDPGYYVSPADGAGIDTFVQTGISSGQAGSTELRAGTYNGGGTLARSPIRWDLSWLPSPERVVTDAYFTLHNFYSYSCAARDVHVHRLGGGFDGATNWATQPPLAGVVTARPFSHGYSGACPAAWEGFSITGLANEWVNQAAPNYGVAVTAPEWDSYAWKKFSSAQTGARPGLHITYNTLPSEAGPIAPADGAVLTTDQPALSVNPASDAEGDPCATGSG